MEQLKKEAYASNTPIIMPIKAVDLQNEHEMVVEWKFNHNLLQDKLMSCNHIKHIGSFVVIFIMLLLLIFSTWRVVDLVRCEHVQMANNMISIVMVVMKLIMM